MVIQGCTVQLQKVLNAVWDKLLPALGQEPLPQDSHGFHRLQKRLERLELNPMLGTRNPGAEASLDGAVYLPDAPTPGLLDLVDGGGHYVPAGHTLESLGFSFQGGKATLVFHQDNGSLELPVGLEGHFLSAPLEGTVLGANGRWRNRNTLEVEVRNTRMVSGQRMLFQFAGDKLTVSGGITLPDNGGLAGKCLEPVTFTLREGEVSTKTKMYWEQ